jgi:hypothetical protein
MPEIIHFRGADEILKAKNIDKDVQVTMEYLEECLYGSLCRRELTNQALKECDWREDDLTILPGRRYQYKGFKRGVALEGSFSAYEFILEGLFRLQVGFDKGKVETGVLMLTNQRSENSKLGTSIELAQAEIEMLFPTISMPVTIALFDLGEPELPEEHARIGEGDDDFDTAEQSSAEQHEEPWP